VFTDRTSQIKWSVRAVSWDEVFEWNESLWFHIECFELQFKETTLGRKLFTFTFLFYFTPHQFY